MRAYARVCVCVCIKKGDRAMIEMSIITLIGGYKTFVNLLGLIAEKTNIREL